MLYGCLGGLAAEQQLQQRSQLRFGLLPDSEQPHGRTVGPAVGRGWRHLPLEVPKRALQEGLLGGVVAEKDHPLQRDSVEQASELTPIRHA